ncbi:MAG: hypothetical protein WA790_10940 [Sulfitobacter sp.]
MFKKTIILTTAVALSACGGPLAGLDRIGNIELADEGTAAQAVPTDEEIAREGFFGTPAATGETTTPDLIDVEPKKRSGLLGLFRRDEPKPDDRALMAGPAQVGDVSQPATEEQNTQTAALNPTPEPKRAGFLGRSKNPVEQKERTGPDARDVPFGTILPYGVVARVCDAKGKSMGQKVENAPAKGFALYDSTPGSAVARTYYITGFADDCPRQLTAANVLLGAPSRYEELHYGPAGQHLAVAATDEAYEKVKSRVCGARKGRPCGSKMKRLEKTTFFVSAYDSFGNSARWSELLIHDGEVVAAAIKTNG